MRGDGKESGKLGNICIEVSSNRIAKEKKVISKREGGEVMEKQIECDLEQYREQIKELFAQAKEELQGKRRLIPFYSEGYWRAKKLLEARGRESRKRE